MFIPRKLLIFAFAFITLVSLGVFLIPNEASSQTTVVAIVKLYSGDAMAAKWDAISIGRVEGDTYVFKTAYGVREREVRIRGKYSVEIIPQ